MKKFIYNGNYYRWKSWKTEEFGSISEFEFGYYNKLFKRFSLNTKKNFSILEIGFGNGSFLEFSRKNKFNVEGIEVNKILLNKN